MKRRSLLTAILASPLFAGAALASVSVGNTSPSIDRMPSLPPRHSNWAPPAGTRLDMAAWNACARDGLTEEHFFKTKVWLAVDRPTALDMTSIGIVIECSHGQALLPGAKMNDAIAVFAPSFLPHGAPDASVVGDLVTMTPGFSVDAKVIIEELEALSMAFDVQGIVFDVYQAHDIKIPCFDLGLPVFTLENTSSKLTATCHDLFDRVALERLVHGGDLLLSASALGTSFIEKDNGSMRPIRMPGGSTNKSAPLMSVLMANAMRIDPATAEAYVPPFRRI